MKLDVVRDEEREEEGFGISRDFDAGESSHEDAFSGGYPEGDRFDLLLGHHNLELGGSETLGHRPRNEQTGSIVQFHPIPQIDLDELESRTGEWTDGHVPLPRVGVPRPLLQFLLPQFVREFLLVVLIEYMIDERRFARVRRPDDVHVAFPLLGEGSDLIQQRTHAESALARYESHGAPEIPDGLHAEIFQFSPHPILRPGLSHLGRE
mmetsp:Transcript_53992/g.161605  ORF Transcript_53992/g.161605 Transcript_53992/m.161605 type:complete len:208 (-) Transcript_53992:1291-1914(-)